MSGIQSDFELDLGPALGAVDELRAAIETSFEAAAGTLAEDVTASIALLSSAAPALTLQLDTDPASSTLGEFVSAAQSTEIVIPLSADTVAAFDALTALTAQITAPIDFQVGIDTTDAATTITTFSEQLTPAVLPVDADLSAADAAVAAFEANAGVQTAIVPVDADTALAATAVDAFVQAADAATAQVAISADTTGAQETVDQLVARLSAESADVIVGADVSSARAAVDTLAGSLPSVVLPFDADPTAARETVAQFETDTANGLATLPVGADTGAASDAIRAFIDQIATVTVAVPVDADTASALAAVENLATVAQAPLVVPVEADTAAAATTIDAFAASPPAALVQVDADTTAAQSALDQFDAAAASSVTTVGVAADTTPATAALEQFLTNVSTTPIEIPADVDTTLAREAITQIVTDVSAAAATISIDADTAPADATLTAYENTLAGAAPAQLPVDADTTPAQDAVTQFVHDAARAEASVSITAETADATTALDRFVVDAGTTHIVVPVEADTAPALSAVEALITDVASPPAVLQVDADTGPAQTTVDAFAQGLSNDAAASVPVTADTSDADAAVAAFEAGIAAAAGDVTVGADTDPARTAIDALITQIGTDGGTLPVDAETAPATDAVTALIANIAANPATIPIDADTTAATTTIDAFGQNLAPATLPLAADPTDAQRTLDQFAADAGTATATVNLAADPAAADTTLNEFVASVVDRAANVAVNADTIPAADAVAALVADIAAPVIMPVDADVTAAQATVDAFSANVGSGAPAVIAVDADLSAAQAAVEAFAAAALASPAPIPISADDSQALATLQDVVGKIDATPAVLQVSADIGSIADAVSAALSTLSDIQTAATIPIDANTAPAEATLTAFVGDLNAAIPAVLPVDADTTAAQATVSTFDQSLGAEGGVVSVGADTSPATDAVGQLVTATDASSATIPVDADTIPAEQAVARLATDISSPAIVPVDADTTPAQSTIDGFTTGLGSGTPGLVPVDADTTGAQTTIDALLASIGASPADLPIIVDTAAADTALADLIASIGGSPADIPVDANVTAANATIAGVVAAPVTLAVEADTSGAIDSIDQLGQAATDAIGGGATGAGGGGVDGLTSSVNLLQGVTGAATADVSEVAASFKELGGEGSAVAIGGGAAFTAFLGEAVNLAGQSQAANRSFAETFGTIADKVKTIDVGGLNISLDDLGKRSGTASNALENAATKVGLLGRSSQASNDQIAKTTDQILALGGTLSVTNPSLGDAATVSERLTTVLGRGGRVLNQYGISLTTSQIQTKALAETGKTSAADLTQFERAAAGADLAVAQFGGTLGDRFASGADNAIVKLKALKTQVEEAIAQLGAPLLSPVLSVLTDLVPVAIDAGKILGDLARIVLPLLSGFAPALVPVELGLKLVGDGLGVLADAVSHLSGGELIGIAAGVTALGAAALIATFGVEFLANALAGALLTPAGLAITALATLGLLFDAFGSKGPSAADRAKSMTDALFGTAAGADTLSGQLAKLDDNIHKVAQSFIDAAPPASDIRKNLDGVGGGVDGVQKALQDSDADFKTYVKNLKAAGDQSLEGKVATGVYIDSLKQQRQALQDAETGQIANLLSTHAVTTAQEAAAEATVKQKEGYVDLAAVLKILTGISDAKAEADQKATLATSIHSGAVRDAVNAMLAGGESAATFKGALETLGVATADATKLSKDLEAEQTKTTDALLLGGPAAQHLAQQFAAGTITAGAFEGQLAALGVSVGGAAAQVKAVSTAIDTFVTSAAKLAPSIDTALTDAESNQTKAQQALDKANAALDKANQHKTDLIDKANIAVENALNKGGKGQQKAIDAANVGLFKAASDGNKIVADATQTAAEANLRLIAAADPQRVIDALNKGLTDIANFQANLAKIVAAGGEELASSLASQGPKVAGAQAAAFAQDPKGVKISEALIGKTDAAKQSYSTWLDTTFGPDIAATIEAQSGIVSQSWHPQFTTETRNAVVAAARVLQEDQSPQNAATRSGEGINAAYSGRLDLHKPTLAQVFLATAALRDAGIPTDAATLANLATGHFGSGLDLAGKTKGAIGASASVWNGDVTTTTAVSARRGGNVIGGQFDLGIRDGINDPFYVGQVTAAATAVAAAADTAARARLKQNSPSLVGVDIGQQFNAGIAIGLGDTNSISTASFAATSILVQNVVNGLTSAAPQIAAAGTTIHQSFSQIVPGFNDLAAIDAATTKLKHLFDVETQQAAATAALSAGQQALNSFVSSASRLPDAAAGIAAFGNAVTTAMSAVTKAETADQKARDKLASDTSRLQGNVVTAQNKLASAITQGAPTSVIFKDQDAVNKAQHALTVQTLLDTKAVEDSQKSLGQTRKQLAAAQDPTAFIRQISAQTAQSRKFEDDLKVLLKEHLPELATSLAEQGPQAAGKLADALVASPAKARLAEAALQQAETFSTHFTDFLQNNFAAEFGAPAAKIGTTVGKAIGTAATSALTGSGETMFANLVKRAQVTAGLIPSYFTNATDLLLSRASTVPVTQLTGARQTAVPNGPQSLELALTVHLPDGTIAQADPVKIPIDANKGDTLAQLARLSATVKAKVQAGT